MNPDDEEPDDEVVVAPGGPVPRSRTHYVPPGYAVRADPDGSLHVEPVPEPPEPDEAD